MYRFFLLRHPQKPFGPLLCTYEDGWFCRHIAYIRLFAKHDVSLFPVARVYTGHSIAFLALVFWILQLLTGFLLLGLLA